ncbi:hypothetical protein SAMN05444157_1610 [Frankineae bacterium MT45]|nr:hypothetical protein SAMN05444157_1610 [Frankineae bacterium MT45]
MAWLRTGDNAAVNPIVLRVASTLRKCLDTVLERDVIKCELFGFVSLCATLSAAFDQDYYVGEETAFSVAGPRTDRLLKLAVQSGYMIKQGSGANARYKIIDDPAFIHMRLKAEREWEQQQAKDNADPGLTVPVRHRDGDACRYCRVIVNFRDRKGKRGGTYDHRTPGVEAKSPHDLVVACRACNASRKDDPQADERIPLLDPPTHPFYGNDTATFLAAHKIIVTPTENLRPGSWPDTAHTSDPDNEATSTRTPRTSDLEATEITHQVDPTITGSADSADHLTEGSGFSGTGRDGTGSQVVPNPSFTRGKRSRRGRPRTGDRSP